MGKKKNKTRSKATVELTSSSSNNTHPCVEEKLNSASTDTNIMIKICRLCEAKDGPFLYIFDEDTITYKKLQDLMPFVISKSDDLPHKICFRCSAKVEEFFEFIQKCIKTQESLMNAFGKKGPVVTKLKSRTLWENKLNQKNMSNDDICDALLKKALEEIKDIPVKRLNLNDCNLEINKKTTIEKEIERKIDKEKTVDIKHDVCDDEVPLNQLKLAADKSEEKLKTGCSNLKNEILNNKTGTSNLKDEMLSSKLQLGKAQTEVNSFKDTKVVETQIILDSDSDCEEDKVTKSKDASVDKDKGEKTKLEEKSFNIMDHISMIKVNGVGILFQCKLCNRNFLKKEVVKSHGCAKHGVPKVDFIKNIIQPELPKTPTIKYINTKTDNEPKNLPDDKKSCPEAVEPDVKATKPKPRIGPASKVKKMSEDASRVENIANPRQEAQEKKESNVTPIQSEPLVKFPSYPSLNSRYKLVPGPSNTFILVEDKNNCSSDETANTASPNTDPEYQTHRKRKHEDNKKIKSNSPDPPANNKKNESEIIDLDKTTSQANKPYPVGLIRAVQRSTNLSETPAPFTTTQSKKHTYMVVPTGNPSKLLISTKPQASQIEEVQKKRPKKGKESSQTNEPFTVTLEDTAPPKDDRFLNFINVDPLLQPSYVLPTDSIQEAQISTSTSKDSTSNSYTCNLCNKEFSREKKLLAHIQSHYTELDEEDNARTSKTTKRKCRK